MISVLHKQLFFKYLTTDRLLSSHNLPNLYYVLRLVQRIEDTGVFIFFLKISIPFPVPQWFNNFSHLCLLNITFWKKCYLSVSHWITVFNLNCRLKITWGAFKNPETQGPTRKNQNHWEKNSGISGRKTFPGVSNVQPRSKSRQKFALKSVTHIFTKRNKL